MTNARRARGKYFPDGFNGRPHKNGRPMSEVYSGVVLDVTENDSTVSCNITVHIAKNKNNNKYKNTNRY